MKKTYTIEVELDVDGDFDISGQIATAICNHFDTNRGYNCEVAIEEVDPNAHADVLHDALTEEVRMTTESSRIYLNDDQITDIVDRLMDTDRVWDELNFWILEYAKEVEA